jgi:uncharacterized protein YhaN
MLLEQIDEATYERVFAVGLDEMQELRTLNDTKAAEQLYSLTIGIDRVSLAEVMRELAASRRHWLGDVDGEGQIGRLLAERSRLQNEIDTQSDAATRYAQLVAERQSLGRQTEDLEHQLESIKDELQLIEVARALRDKWSERAAIDAQLAPLDVSDDLPAGLLERLEAIRVGIRSRKRRWQKLHERRRKLAAQARQVVPQRKLLDQASRIHAVAEQHDWVLGLQRKVASLTTDQREVLQDLELQKSTLGLDVTSELLKTVNVQSLVPLKSLARTLGQRRKELDEARREVVQQPQPQPVVTTNTRPPAELIAATQAAGQKVSLLRRRVQVNQRLEQMAAQQQELEEQSGELADKQLLPLPLVMILGTVFVLGVVLLLAGWWLNFGWVVSVFGAASMIGSVVMKYYLERSADQQLDHCDRQLATLRQQMEQLKQQRKELDAEIPPGGGPLLARLEAAEAELARLEGLLPLEAQRKPIEPPTIVRSNREPQAEKAYQESLRTWRQALHAAGWPAKMTPKQVWQAAHRAQQLRGQLRRQKQLQDDLELAKSALGSFTERLRQLAADVGLLPASDLPQEILRQLRQDLKQQESIASERRELARRNARYRRRQLHERKQARRLMRQRTQLVRQAGAMDEADLRRRVAEHALRSKLRAAREVVEREIAATLGLQLTEEAVCQYVERSTPMEVDQRRLKRQAELAQTQTLLRERLERRGQVLQQMHSLADDRRLGQLQLELGEVDARLKQAVERWRTVAVASRTMEEVRQLYERQRQPEALQEASTWLARLTRGRYTRVWTPLGEDELLIDDAHGQAWQVATFSRGTREQLFLALRLALVASYARRGVRLPMVLDDVLVNFDADRAKAAAEALNDFALAGHQLVVFTCHEHLAVIFQDLGVSVRQLPTRSGEAVQRWTTPKKKSLSRRKREPDPETAVAAEPPVEPALAQPSPPAEETIEPLPEAPPVIVEVVAGEPELPVTEYQVAPPEAIEPTTTVFVEPAPEPLFTLEATEPALPVPARRRKRSVLRKPRRSPQEAMFTDYDGLFPWNEEPADAAYYLRDEAEEMPQPWIDTLLTTGDELIDEERWDEIDRTIQREWVTVADDHAVEKSVWIGGHWLGEGAEEFAGEFAVRPQPIAELAEEALLRKSGRSTRRSKRTKEDNDAEAA